MSVETKVKDIIAKQLDVDFKAVTPEALISDELGGDSLDTVELMMAFDEEFNLDIPDEDAEKMLKVEDVIKYIKDKT